MTNTNTTVSQFDAAVAAAHHAAVALESATAEKSALLADERRSFATGVATISYARGVAIRARYAAALKADHDARRDLRYGTFGA